jgi:hypothetical protein
VFSAVDRLILTAPMLASPDPQGTVASNGSSPDPKAHNTDQAIRVLLVAFQPGR